MTAVADAIRTKTGSSESLAFPDGFVSAVEGISGEGAVDPVAEKFRLIARDKGQDVDLTWEDILSWFGTDTNGNISVTGSSLIANRKLNSLEVNPNRILNSTSFSNINCNSGELGYETNPVTIKAPAEGVRWEGRNNHVYAFFYVWIREIDEAFFASNLYRAFHNCYFPDDIVVSEGVTYVLSPFDQCEKAGSDRVKSSLTISFPTTLTTIGASYGGISGGYSNKMNLVFKSTTPPTLGSSLTIGNVNSITVPKGCLEAYQTATNWSQYADIMVEAEE